MSNHQQLTNNDLATGQVDGSWPNPTTLTGATDPDLLEEVRTGLVKTPKQLSSRFLYDAEGSRIFGEIMRSPEYYLTRSEYEILETHGADLVHLFTAGTPAIDLVELGAGDGLKTKLLLEQLQATQALNSYIPVDISTEALAGLVDDIQQQWPAMPVRPQCTDYLTALDQLASNKQSARQVVLFLGSSIGNFRPSETLNFYRNLSNRLRPGDLVLTGFDLQKHPAVVHAAYNDQQGLTKAFNLNLLRRINRELQANFDLSAFDHYECYNPERGEARSYLVSQKAQLVHIPALDMTVSFACGEIIYTEISRKFKPGQIEELAQRTGFSIKASFTDSNGYFIDVVFQKQ